MQAPAVVDHVRKTLPDPAAFYRPAHQTIYIALLELADADGPTDPISVQDRLERAGELGRVGGLPYLFEVHQAGAYAADPLWHADIVARHAHLRHAQVVATRILQRVAGGDVDPEELLRTARAELDKTLDDITAATITPANTWQAIDLTDVVNGGTLANPPTILVRDDGHALLYPGKVHTISGEPESGKTWLLLHAVADLITSGQAVLYLDFEDSAESLVARLRALGCPPEAITENLAYVRPDAALDDPGRAVLTAVLTRGVALTVIDGVTEAMALHGYDPLKNNEYAAWFSALPRWIAAHPCACAVSLIDHVPKDEERNRRYALGAQHKLAVIDGAAYMVDIIRPFGVGQHGISRIRISKDKPGRVREHAVGGAIGDLHLESDGTSVNAFLRSPRPYDEVGGFRPTHLMEKLSRFIEVNPRLSKKAIEEVVKGKATAKRAALELLVSEGYVTTERGDRGAILHRHVKPYREADDER